MGFNELEAAGKKALEQFPVVKRSAKRVYQVASVMTNRDKVKAEGNLLRVSPDDEYEYFYGYYDKSPWDASDRYMICIKVKQAYKDVAPKEPGNVCLIDTANGNKIIKIGTTHSWNVQQSCMAQWLGPDFKSKIIYNDYRNGQYCSVVYNVAEMKEEKVFSIPVYDVAKDGSFALSLDFNRLHRMRPGYGYSNQPDRTRGILCPDKTCIWKLDLSTGKIDKLFKYTDLASFEPDVTMDGAEHKVNHLMISPNGKRFMVLHRWFCKGRKHTRLVTVNVDKSEMYNLSDDVFVSHSYWKNDDEILSFLRKKETGNHYYLMKDKTQEYRMLWPELNTDGHCSYSPDGHYIITDTYPNRKRIASVYLCTEDDNRSRRIARVYSPFKYDNDCRCDLHPRWNHKGDKICIDSVHEGKRGLYVIKLQDMCINKSQVSERNKVTIIRSNKFKLLDKNVDDKEYCIEDMFKSMSKKDKLICDFHLYSKTKVPERLYNQKLRSLDTDLIIVFDPHCRIEFLEWIRKTNPNTRIILWLWNTVKEIGSNIPLDRVPDNIEIWSYSKYDCEKYNLQYNTTFYPYIIKNTNRPAEYDVLFVGKDKGRLDDILSIKQTLEECGLKTYFHISPTHKYELYFKSVYKSKIPYSTVDELISKSRCILDCEVDSTAGLTIRPLEALYRHKKLITNNKSVCDEDFYNAHNVFIYGKDDNKRLYDFVKSEYVDNSQEVLDEYTMNNWIKRFWYKGRM